MFGWSMDMDVCTNVGHADDTQFCCTVKLTIKLKCFAGGVAALTVRSA